MFRFLRYFVAIKLRVGNARKQNREQGTDMGKGTKGSHRWQQAFERRWLTEMVGAAHD